MIIGQVVHDFNDVIISCKEGDSCCIQAKALEEYLLSNCFRRGENGVAGAVHADNDLYLLSYLGDVRMDRNSGDRLAALGCGVAMFPVSCITTFYFYSIERACVFSVS